MLVLHAAWLAGADGGAGNLLLWGERDAPLRRAARPPRGGAPPAHPFAVSAAALRELVGARVGAADTEVIAHLPAVDGMPLPSPDLGPPDDADEAVRAAIG